MRIRTTSQQEVISSLSPPMPPKPFQNIRILSDLKTKMPTGSGQQWTHRGSFRNTREGTEWNRTDAVLDSLLLQNHGTRPSIGFLSGMIVPAKNIFNVTLLTVIITEKATHRVKT